MSIPQPRIRRLDSPTDADILSLADLLIDCVHGGASVGFMAPLTRDHAIAYWTKVAAAAAAGERLLLIAEDDLGTCGTVQLVLAMPDNQPHRADIAKMLVHTRARRQGLGAALMRGAESKARELGKTLLVLDTVTNSDASRLYQRLGWSRVGDIPNYALFPNGEACSTTYYYLDLTRSMDQSPT